MRAMAVAAMMALLTQPVLAAEVVPYKVIELPRTGQWVLNLDDDSCSIGAAFGEGDGQIVLKLLRFEPSENFEIQLIGRPVDQFMRVEPIKLRFGEGAFDEAAATGGGVNGIPLLLLGWHRLVADPRALAISPAQEAAITSFTFRAPSRQWYRLATSSMKNPLAALRDCTTDLVASWGFDPVQQAGLANKPQPVGNPQDWAKEEDIPTVTGDLRHNAAFVNFRLDVDETGKATACHIQALVGASVYVKPTCDKIAARAQFTPAHDAAGKAVKSYYLNRVVW